MRLIAILSPTDKWGIKTEYSRLRKFLLKDGYIRIGPEVFMRVVQNRKASEKHYRRIDEVKPKTGVVRLLRLTEKQYNNIYMVTEEPDYQEKNSQCKLPYNDIIDFVTPKLYYLNLTYSMIGYGKYKM